MNHLPLQQHTASPWQPPVEARPFRHADGFAAQQPAYYQQHRPQQPPEGVFEREHLFEKPLTPSDVGKLNRLVIPKQHAERYFPLDGESGEKGLLLSFEDEAGKAWRFRYSYWTSSQSYVLTKGWSRFVKEKRLDAGDVVLFEKRRSTGDRLYIGWKRRGAQDGGSSWAADAGAAQLSPEACHPAAAPQHHHSYSCPNGVNPVHDSSAEHGVGQVPYAARSPPAVTATNSRRLRLFGVNLECGPEPEPEPLPPGRGSGAVGSSPCMDMAGDCGRRSLHLPYMHPGGAFYQS